MSTKTEIIEIESENNPLKLQEKTAKERTSRQKRLNWLFHLSLGIMCVVLVLVLTLIHFFFGASQVFSVRFSFPAIVRWLDGLPQVPIREPEAQLARLIIGIVFFLIYIILTIKVITTLVFAIRQVDALHDAKYGKINAQHALFVLFERTSTAYCFAIFFGLVASMTNEQPLPWGLILLLVLYAHFFVIATIKNHMDGRKALGKGEFAKKDVVVDTIKDVLTALFATGLIIACLRPELWVFTQNINLHFKTEQGFTGIAVIERFIFPFLKLFLAFTSILLFKQSLIISARKKAIKEVAFYGQSYHFINQLTPFQKKAKGRMVRVIIFSVICCLLSLLFITFTPQGLVMPENMKAVVIAHLPYIIGIAFSIVTYIFIKKKENRISQYPQI